jgi:chaperone modulatory protein CbpM
MAYAMVRLAASVPTGAVLSLDAMADAAGLHPDLVRRFAVLGLLDPQVDSAGRMWFAPAQLATLRRITRLRSGLGLNYLAIGVVLDLLDRIERLESRARTGGPRVGGPINGGEQRWT